MKYLEVKIIDKLTADMMIQSCEAKGLSTRIMTCAQWKSQRRIKIERNVDLYHAVIKADRNDVLLAIFSKTYHGLAVTNLYIVR